MSANREREGAARSDVAAVLKMEADLAAWAADNEAERATLLAVSADQLDELDIECDEVAARAAALRAFGTRTEH